MLVGLGHVDLVCRNLERSLAFYAAVFGGLGLDPPHLARGERGEAISLTCGSRRRAPARSGLALAVERLEDVDLVHENAVAAGAEVLHAPRFWPVYHPEYYATFFLDPDCHNVEAVFHDRSGWASSSRHAASPVHSSYCSNVQPR